MMDPNASLSEARLFVDRILNVPENDSMDVQDAVDLAERVRALDEWLSRGGFLPDAWQGGRS